LECAFDDYEPTSTSCSLKAERIQVESKASEVDFFTHKTADLAKACIAKSKAKK